MPRPAEADARQQHRLARLAEQVGAVVRCADPSTPSPTGTPASACAASARCPRPAACSSMGSARRRCRCGRTARCRLVELARSARARRRGRPSRQLLGVLGRPSCRTSRASRRCRCRSRPGCVCSRRRVLARQCGTASRIRSREPRTASRAPARSRRIAWRAAIVPGGSKDPLAVAQDRVLVFDHLVGRQAALAPGADAHAAARAHGSACRSRCAAA